MKHLLIAVFWLAFVAGLSEAPQDAWTEKWERDQFGAEAVKDQQELRHRNYMRILEDIQQEQLNRIEQQQQNIQNELNRRR
jgi:hypothetical protein